MKENHCALRLLEPSDLKAQQVPAAPPKRLLHQLRDDLYREQLHQGRKESSRIVEAVTSPQRQLRGSFADGHAAAVVAGELGQREKMAKFLMHVAPGSRAYSLNDWTPFGFKAGGLIAMDLVHEEAMNLTNMLVMDRNANVHDLDALMEPT